VHTAEKPSVQLLFAMIGSVCGTLITGALDTSPTVRLIGAVLGAAVPTLIGYAGPHTHLRATVGIAATAVALFVTYGGFTLFAFATDRPETFPLPAGVPDPDKDQSGSTTVTVHGGPDIKVTPESLKCTSDGCETVTIESTGEKPLEVRTIEFDGEAASEFSQAGDCENHTLDKGQDCRLTVNFTPSAPGTRLARLVIHQNLPKLPTYVPLEGQGSAVFSMGDLVTSPEDVDCVHQQAGAIDHGELKDALQIFFTLRLDGASPHQLNKLVLVSARSNRGPSASARGGIGAGRVAALPLKPDDYGHTHIVTVSLDPNNEVAEDNEANNRLTVRVGVPLHPQSTQNLHCTAK